jgi:aminodeoxyfutalosine deaminase
MTRTLTARWVLPVAGPPLEGGLVKVRDDKIETVEPHGSRAADEDLGNVAIIPGLVNPHTHLDLSGAKGLIPPTDPDHFTDWLKGVIAYRKTRSPKQVQEEIRAGLAECMRFGMTLVGDIANEGNSWDSLAHSPLRAVVFREMLGLSKVRSDEAMNSAGEWYRTIQDTPTCKRGFSPHSPYSASRELINSVTASEWITAIHLAETPGELELIQKQSGPFVEFLRELGAWDPSGLVPYIDRILIRSRINHFALFIHCNYLPIEQCRYIAGIHSVVYCPRTHAAFGHPPHPFREFLARDVRVCLGTDSLASNPDLDILAEARFVHAKYPDFPGDQLLKMVTLSGAEALGWADECGSLEPGKSADLVAVPLPNRNGDPYELLFSDDAKDSPRLTMFRGEWRT